MRMGMRSAAVLITLSFASICSASAPRYAPIVLNHHLYYGQSYTYPIFFVPKEVIFHPSSGVKVAWHEQTHALRFTTTKEGVFGVQVLHPNGTWYHLHVTVYPPHLKSLAEVFQILCLRGGVISSSFRSENMIHVSGIVYGLKDWIFYSKSVQKFSTSLYSSVTLYTPALYLLVNTMNQWVDDTFKKSLKLSYADQALSVKGHLTSPTDKEKLLKGLNTFFPKINSTHLYTGLTQQDQLHLSLEFLEVKNGQSLQFGVNHAQPILLRPSGTLWAALHALLKSGKAKVLSNPKVIARYHKPAHLHIGGELPYEIKTKHRLNLGWKKYGIVLEITPTPVEKASVHLQFKLTVSYPTASPTTSTHLPAFSTRSIQSEVVVPLGHTAILSGMFHQLSHDNTTGTPFLGRVPLLGYLFKTSSIEHKQTELIVSITPKPYGKTSHATHARHNLLNTQIPHVPKL